MTQTPAAPAKPAKLPRDQDPRNPVHRLTALLDEGTMELVTPDDDSGMLAAVGYVDGTRVVAFCSDATVMGGAMGDVGCRVVVDAYHRAMTDGVPIIGLWHSGGARLAEGVLSLHAVGADLPRDDPGLGPDPAGLRGPRPGGRRRGVRPGTDRRRHPRPRGPDLRDRARRRAFRHGRGRRHAAARRSRAARSPLRRGPRADGVRGGGAAAGPHRGQPARSQGALDVASVEDRDLAALLPESKKRAYDVHPLVESLLDEGTMQELHTRWAPNIVTALGRFGGRTVGVVANNPLRLGGCLDSLSAEKASRFVRMCDAFGVPLVVVVDVPGYLPGVGQEWDGVVRRGAKLLHAFGECVVPRVTLVTRKTYGGAYIAMNARSLGATRVFAWPAPRWR